MLVIDLIPSLRIGKFVQKFMLTMQALEVIKELQKHFPIKRAPMRIRFTVTSESSSSLLEQLSSWNGTIVSKHESSTEISIVSLRQVPGS